MAFYEEKKRKVGNTKFLKNQEEGRGWESPSCEKLAESTRWGGVGEG